MPTVATKNYAVKERPIIWPLWFCGGNMHQIDSTFIKLKDDETCALLKPFEPNAPPITHITNEVLKVLHQFPEVRKRVVARLGLAGSLSLE